MKEQPSASPHPGSKWRLPALSWVFGGAEPTEPPAAQLHRLSWAVRCAEPKRTPPFAFTALLRAGRPPPHHSPPALRAHPPHPPVCHEAPELCASSSSPPPAGSEWDSPAALPRLGAWSVPSRTQWGVTGSPPPGRCAAERPIGRHHGGALGARALGQRASPAQRPPAGPHGTDSTLGACGGWHPGVGAGWAGGMGESAEPVPPLPPRVGFVPFEGAAGAGRAAPQSNGGPVRGGGRRGRGQGSGAPFTTSAPLLPPWSPFFHPGAPFPALAAPCPSPAPATSGPRGRQALRQRPGGPGTAARKGRGYPVRARSRRHLSGELRDIAKTGGLGAEGSRCEGLRCRAAVSRGQPAIDQRAHSVLQQQSALAKPIPPLKHKLPLFFPQFLNLLLAGGC